MSSTAKLPQAVDPVGKWLLPRQFRNDDDIVYRSDINTLTRRSTASKSDGRPSSAVLSHPRAAYNSVDFSRLAQEASAAQPGGETTYTRSFPSGRVTGFQSTGYMINTRPNLSGNTLRFREDKVRGPIHSVAGPIPIRPVPGDQSRQIPAFPHVHMGVTMPARPHETAYNGQFDCNTHPPCTRRQQLRSLDITSKAGGALSSSAALGNTTTWRRSLSVGSNAVSEAAVDKGSNPWLSMQATAYRPKMVQRQRDPSQSGTLRQAPLSKHTSGFATETSRRFQAPAGRSAANRREAGDYMRGATFKIMGMQYDGPIRTQSPVHG